MKPALITHITWAHNAKRLRDYPPLEVAHRRTAFSDPSSRIANYDYYRDIVNISYMLVDDAELRHEPQHIIVHPQAPTQRVVETKLCVPDSPRYCKLYLVANEAEALSQFWAEFADLMTMYCDVDVAGWNLATGTWPFFIGKSLQYNAHIASKFKPSLEAWSQGQRKSGLLAVEQAYTSEHSIHTRMLPDLADIISWWGLPTNDTHPMLGQRELAALGPDAWVTTGYKVLNKYLNAMADIMARLA